MYSSEQTRALLAAADPGMRILILIALKCGLREQELMHVEFRDIDWVPLSPPLSRGRSARRYTRETLFVFGWRIPGPG